MLSELKQTDPYALGDEHENLYRSEREYLLKRRNELGDLFDKGRVALASGTLALTFALLKEDLRKVSHLTTSTVAVGASFMAACLLLSLLCVYGASQSFDRRVDILDDDRRAGCGQERLHGTCGTAEYRRDRWANGLQWMNPLSYATLVVGIIITGIGVFGALSETNSTRETSMSSKETKTTKKGEGDSTKSLGSKDRPITNNNSGNSSGAGKTEGGKKK